MKQIQGLLDAIRQPACAADEFGDIVAANAMWIEATGARGLNDATVRWNQCLGGPDGEGQAAWRHALSRRENFSGQVRFGATRTGEYTASPVLDGHPRSLWLVVLSSTPYVAPTDFAATALALQAAQRAGRMGVWEWDTRTPFASWSPELYELLRLPAGTGVEPSERFLAMVHPDDSALVAQLLTEVDERSGIGPVILRIVDGHGDVRSVMSCGKAERDAAGTITRLVGVNFDVTESVQSQENLDRAKSAERRQHQIVAAVMEHVPVGLAVTIHGDESLSFVSQFGIDMMRSASADATAWDAWQVYHLDGKTPARVEEMALHRAARGEVIRHEEWYIRAEDGSLLPVSCNAGPIRTAEGEVMGGIVAWYDVTPFKEAHQQRDRFLAAISHELRTPLSAITGWSAVMRKSLDDQPTLARALDSIEKNVWLEARLVDDLLDVSRIAAGTFGIDLKPVDFVRVVDGALETILPIALSSEIVIDVEHVVVLPIEGDELRLRQAVLNLLTNAVKFSRPGGLVQVIVEAVDHAAQLRVVDHGVGLDASHLDLVFDSFWQADASEKRARSDGLGLGLAIAKHIVTCHGGTLHAASQGVGHGATFTVRMPLRSE